MTPGLARLVAKTGGACWFEGVDTIEELVFTAPIDNPADLRATGYYWMAALERFLEESGPHLREIYFHKAEIERQVPHFRHEEDFASAREALAALAEAITAGHADPKPFVEARRKRCLLYNPHGTQEVWRTECYDEGAIRAALPREPVLQWIERYEALALADLLGE